MSSYSALKWHENAHEKKNSYSNYKNVLKNLKSSWTALTEDPQISMSWPNKVHYIVDHFQDYFEDPLVNGEALGNTTDQLIEHMHSEIDKIMKIGGYWVNDAEKCGKKQHNAILKINAFSVNIK